MPAESTDREYEILIVDDLRENINILSRFLTPMGYRVTSASCGEDALRLAMANPPDLVLLDLMMPGMSGFEVCRELKQNPATCHVPVIIITGLADSDANIKATAAGADDFLLKPFDRVLLEARLRSSLKTKRLHDELVAHQRALEARVEERTRQLIRAQRVTVFSLAKLSESRDNETGDHLERIRAYCRVLAEELLFGGAYPDQVNAGFVDEIYHSCPLHDIGKVGIPDMILLKPGKLTPAEFEIMKAHSTIGGDTLSAADKEVGDSSFLDMGRDIAYGHHEKFDGSGYPRGTAGEAIPLSARITALADVYDALSSRRPYKKPFPHEKSRGIILEGRGTHFDPVVVDAFLAREQEFIAIRDEYQGKGGLAPLAQLVRAAQKNGEQGVGYSAAS